MPYAVVQNLKNAAPAAVQKCSGPYIAFCFLLVYVFTFIDNVLLLVSPQARLDKGMLNAYSLDLSFVKQLYFLEFSITFKCYYFYRCI